MLQIQFFLYRQSNVKVLTDQDSRLFHAEMSFRFINKYASIDFLFGITVYDFQGHDKCTEFLVSQSHMPVVSQSHMPVLYQFAIPVVSRFPMPVVWEYRVLGFGVSHQSRVTDMCLITLREAVRLLHHIEHRAEYNAERLL